MATDGERIARVEQRLDSSEQDRRDIWAGMRDIGDIKIAVARILERLDTGAGNFREIKGDLEGVFAQISEVREMIPKRLEERLAALEANQKADSMKVALIWTGSVALAATAVTFLKDWISHTFWK